MDKTISVPGSAFVELTDKQLQAITHYHVQRVDVLIVGNSVSGALMAEQLSESGLRHVLLLDAAAPPPVLQAAPAKPTSVLRRAFHDTAAAARAGFPAQPTGRPLGWSAAAIRRDNLDLRFGARVDKVLCDGRRVVGVQLDNGQHVLAREVLLCCGTYDSAAILLRSGIGPAESCRELGIALVADLPVGLCMSDQPRCRIAVTATATAPVPGRASVFATSSSAEDGVPDLRISLVEDEHCVLEVVLTRPLSRGVLSLSCSSPLARPLVGHNFLAAPQDGQRLLEGVKLALALAASEPLARQLALIPSALTEAASEDVLLSVVKAMLEPTHDPISSAPMGRLSDPSAVVDGEGRVHGITRLRVVDASVFAEPPAVPRLLALAALAERIARQFDIAHDLHAIPHAMAEA